MTRYIAMFESIINILGFPKGQKFPAFVLADSPAEAERVLAELYKGTAELLGDAKPFHEAQNKS